MASNIFNNLFKSSDSNDSGVAVISAIIVEKSKATEDFEKELVSKGFKVDKCKNEEATVVYEQDVPFAQEDHLIKLSDSLFVAVANVQKGFRPFGDGGSFADNFKKGAFFPTISIATDVLKDTILNIMISEETKEPPVLEVEKALGEFSAFVLQSMKAIPKEAYKLDGLLASEDGGPVPTTKTEGTAVDEAKIQEIVKKSINDFLTTEQEQVISKMEKAVDAIKTDIISEIKKASDAQSEKHAELAKKVDGIEITLKNQQGVIDGYDAKLKEAEGKATEAAESAKKSEDQVKGTLQAGSLDADPDQVPKAKRDADDPNRVFKANEGEGKDNFWSGTFDALDELIPEEIEG